MIDYKNNTIVRAGITKPIERWVVWFMTPFGLAEELSEALGPVEEAGLNPHIVIKAIPVALAADTYEVST